MKDDILKILNELRPEFSFSEDLNFVEEGMIDSFDLVTLVTILDETYNISISGIDILPENFSSLDNIIALIKKNGGE